jgi:hypothetical protein
MSVPVSPEALRATAAEFGERAYLVTVNDQATPHVASVVVAMVGDALVCGAGKSTRANVGVHPTATLVWAPTNGGAYSLIVDGEATASDDGVTIAPTSAVLHRLAGMPGDGPTCRPVSA